MAQQVYTAWIVILYMFVVGVAAGWLGWVITGKSKALKREGGKPNYAMLMLLGIVGSFVGGALASLLTGQGLELRASGLIGSAVGAVIVVAIYSAVKKR